MAVLKDFGEKYNHKWIASPIAIIRAVRMYYDVGRLPSKTKMIMDIDESSAQSYPLLEGWTLPGDCGWRVINATPQGGALVTRR